MWVGVLIITTMNIYIRYRKGIWIEFIHNVQELRDLIDNYIPERKIVIGDVSTFNQSMNNMLLKFVEDNPQVSLYSSLDINNPIIVSRAVKVFKEPITYTRSNSVEQFLQSDRSVLSAQKLLASSPNQIKLLSPLVPNHILPLLV